jgi:hypothetical protein
MYTFHLRPLNKHTTSSSTSKQHVTANKQLVDVHFKVESDSSRHTWIKLIQSHIMPESLAKEYDKYLAM